MPIAPLWSSPEPCSRWRSITCNSSSGASMRCAAQAAYSATVSAKWDWSTQASTFLSCLFMPFSSVAHQQVVGPVLVVHGEPVDHRCAGLVEADDLDLRAFAAELDHHLVERTDRRDVPEVGARHVDHHLVDHFAEVEGGDEGVGRGEEYLAADRVAALATFVLGDRTHAQQAANLVREEEARGQHADQHALSQVVGGDGDRDGGDHHDARA